MNEAAEMHQKKIILCITGHQIEDSREVLSGTHLEFEVQALLDAHTSRRTDHGQRIWQLMFLELWFRTYIDRPRAALTGPLALT